MERGVAAQAPGRIGTITGPEHPAREGLELGVDPLDLLEADRVDRLG